MPSPDTRPPEPDERPIQQQPRVLAGLNSPEQLAAPVQALALSGGGYLGSALSRLYGPKRDAQPVQDGVARDDSVWLSARGRENAPRGRENGSRIH